MSDGRGVWPVVFTIPFRVLGALWPGRGCVIWLILGLMLLGALY